MTRVCKQKHHEFRLHLNLLTKYNLPLNLKAFYVCGHGHLLEVVVYRRMPRFKDILLKIT